MEYHSSDSVNPTTSLYAVVGGLLSVILLVFLREGYRNALSFPLAGKDSYSFPSLRARLGWLLNGATYIDQAFERYPDQIFKLPNLDRPSLVLPPKFLDEVKNAPESILSNGWATTDFFVGKWTAMDYTHFDHSNLESVKKQYISRLRPHVETAANEADHAISRIFSAHEEWSPMKLYEDIRPIVLQMTTRSIVGPELCRNPQWIQLCMNYSKNVVITATYIKILPPLLHHLAYLMPEFYRLKWNKWALQRLLEPETKRYLEDRRRRGGSPIEKSIVTTMLDCYSEILPEHEMKPHRLAHRLIGCSFGAFQLTAGLVMNSILDLATHFDTHAPALRQEIDEVLGDEEHITNGHLTKMWKLDSFIKESLRFHPPSTLSCSRKVMQPFQLSSGIVIPTGTHISLPGGSMSLSDAYIPNAKTFDGFRFERMRLDPTQNKNGLQFTSASPAAMHMGAGSQQCPGRFFGAAVAKILLIKLLKRFDMKLKGEKRPENLKLGDADAVHPESEIMIIDRVY